MPARKFPGCLAPARQTRKRIPSPRVNMDPAQKTWTGCMNMDRVPGNGPAAYTRTQKGRRSRPGTCALPQLVG